MKYTLVFFFPQDADGIRMASISAGVFAFNSYVYGILPFLFLRTNILTPCPNPFLRFTDSEPAEWIRI